MKKSLVQIILFSIICILLNSCSVYEDVYFNKDGTVSYSLKYDASQMLAMAPGALSSNYSKTDMVLDTTFYIVDMFEQYRDSTYFSSAEDREILEDLKPLYIVVHTDTISKEFTIALHGDFVNTDAMNNAFVALNLSHVYEALNPKMDNTKKYFDINYASSRYSWNGKKMTRTVIEDGSSDEPVEELEGYNEMVIMFSGGKMITRYHFPKKVKSVNKKEALFSKDRKTIVIEQPAITHLKPVPEEFDIAVEIE